MEISVILTNEQIKDICNFFSIDMDNIEEYEIGEIVDKIIDDYLCTARMW